MQVENCAKPEGRALRIMTPDPRKQSPARLRATEERLHLLRKRLGVPTSCLPQLWPRCMPTTNPTQTPGLFSSSTQDPPFFPSSGVSQTADETLCVEDHLPPTSMASTTRQALARRPTSSGVSLFLARSLIVRRFSPGRPIAVQSAHQCGNPAPIGLLRAGPLRVGDHLLRLASEGPSRAQTHSCSHAHLLLYRCTLSNAKPILPKTPARAQAAR